MPEEQSISIEQRSRMKEKPKVDELGFGKFFTDHMFIMDFSTEKGWYDPRIIPYQPLTIDPAAMVFHYGQSVFEGLKAYRAADGNALLFRPLENLKRMNNSNERMCIPTIDENFVLQALKKLILIDEDWIPNKQGTSLYIRPYVIATEPFLGVSTSQCYKFIIILSPVGAYYKEGINPVSIMVENDYVRAVVGGTGEAKTGGNYAASLKAQQIANEQGYAQVMWMDGVEKKYIEEVGAMNVFFKINGEVVTPALHGSILPGITRKSTIQLLKHWGIPVIERKITLKELFTAQEEGTFEEAFGTGTAAVISPIGKLAWNDSQIIINNGETGTLAARIYDTLTGIQYGEQEDTFHWNERVTEKATTR